MNITDMDLDKIEEKIATVAGDIESCKRVIRAGDDARKKYLELLNQLDILAAAYVAKRSASK